MRKGLDWDRVLSYTLMSLFGQMEEDMNDFGNKVNRIVKELVTLRSKNREEDKVKNIHEKK